VQIDDMHKEGIDPYREIDAMDLRKLFLNYLLTFEY
jgi:hypothetical protein